MKNSRLLNFYAENEEWLENLAKNSNRPTILRAIALTVLKAGEEKLKGDSKKDVG